MRFLLTKELGHSALLRHLIMAVVFFLLLFVAFDAVLHAMTIGLDASSVSLTLFGDTENFIEPILLDALLLQVHIDIFSTLFTLLILSSVYIRLYAGSPWTKQLVHALLVFGILAPLTLLCAFFFGKVFVWVWIVTFVAWHFLALLFGLLIFKKLLAI